MLCKLAVSNVASCEETGENTVLISAAYGRKSGIASTSMANDAAAQRSRPRRTSRGAPYLPPSTA